MFTYKVFSFLLMLYVTKSEVDFETTCRNDYRNMNNDIIDVLKYCSNNICIEKCCCEGEMLNARGACVKKTEFFKKFKQLAYLSSVVDYSKIALYSWDGNNKERSNKDFVFVRNQRDLENCTAAQSKTEDFFILEDGSVRIRDTNGSKSWSKIPSLNYCVDFKLIINPTPEIKLFVRQYYIDPKADGMKSMYLSVGLLISSFFLLLVLVVYCLLPDLQNIIGLVLMSYSATLLVTFLLQSGILLSIRSMGKEHCKIISPVKYFALISSFFWLNVMSFDVWWSLRGHRKRRDIHRRGELVKFMWYCLYAWGVPLLITAIVVILDNIDLSNVDNIVKPPFDDCFNEEIRVHLYVNILIGIIIFVNIILFVLTVYNIWMIKRAVQRCQDSRSSERDNNRFVTYIKLSILMGVNWCLELSPSNTVLWVFILTSIYNILIGVIIFFVFVFNKQILGKLCMRFNIQNKFTKSLEASQISRSGTSKSSREIDFVNTSAV